MFRVDVHIHSVDEREINQKLQFISNTLATLAQQGVIMAGELQALQAEVVETQAKLDEVAATLTALIAKVIENQGDPAALQQLAADLEASQRSVDDELAAAAAVLNPPAPAP